MVDNEDKSGKNSEVEVVETTEKPMENMKKKKLNMDTQKMFSISDIVTFCQRYLINNKNATKTVRELWLDRFNYSSNQGYKNLASYLLKDERVKKYLESNGHATFIDEYKKETVIAELGAEAKAKILAITNVVLEKVRSGTIKINTPADLVSFATACEKFDNIIQKAINITINQNNIQNNIQNNTKPTLQVFDDIDVDKILNMQ